MAGLPSVSEARDLLLPERLRVAGCGGWIVAVTLAFIQPLTGLMLSAVQSELHSYIPLVPFVAGYLLYIQRRALATAYRSSIGGTMLLGGVGVAALAAAIRSEREPERQRSASL